METPKSHIKKRCVACNKRITYSQERYMIRGNYCDSCSGKAGERALANQKESAKKLINGDNLQAS